MDNEILDNSGPAFPCRAAVPGMAKILIDMHRKGCQISMQEINDLSHLHPGMSLRDYFAGKALVGMMSRDSFDKGQSTPEQRARLAYIEANAMIKERNGDNNATDSPKI